MKTLTGSIIGILGVAMMLSSCGSSGGSNDSGGGSQGSGSKLSAAFGSNCASCHGATGGGASERSLQGFTGPSSAFLSVVRSGIGRMPATPSTVYSDADVEADYQYLKSL